MIEKDKKRKPSKAVREAYALVGSMGGKATVKKHGKDHMAKIGKLGSNARWKNRDK